LFEMEMLVLIAMKRWSTVRANEHLAGSHRMRWAEESQGHDLKRITCISPAAEL
jgi:hypothetical protein